jgi:hypothetical protein
MANQYTVAINSLQSFVLAANEKHGTKYDYQHVSFSNLKTQVTIVCPVHGEFRQTPHQHLRTSGCTKCGLGNAKRGLTHEQFMERCRLKHGDRYDYTRTQYVRKDDKVTIGCPDHGYFEQVANSHMRGFGCQKCQKRGTSSSSNSGFRVKDTIDDFVVKARTVHGDRYDYTKSEYVNSVTPLVIVCNVHGEFLQKPNNHLTGQQCPKCARIDTYTKQRMTLEHFLALAKIKHGEKYEYHIGDVELSCDAVIQIQCEVHGMFVQRVSDHVYQGCGCQLCSNHVQLTTDEFIRRAREAHGDKYDYSGVDYKVSYEKVDIICPKHGLFQQTAEKHYRGEGCRQCGSEIAVQKLEEWEWPYKWKDFMFPCGKLVRVQGYEPKAISYLIDQGYSSEDLVLSRSEVPVVEYVRKGRPRRYFVDIYILSENRMIEVKSPWTFGLGINDGSLCLKSDAALAAGYKFEIWIFAKNSTSPFIIHPTIGQEWPEWPDIKDPPK